MFVYWCKMITLCFFLFVTSWFITQDVYDLLFIIQDVYDLLFITQNIHTQNVHNTKYYK